MVEGIILGWRGSVIRVGVKFSHGDGGNHFIETLEERSYNYILSENDDPSDLGYYCSIDDSNSSNGSEFMIFRIGFQKRSCQCLENLSQPLF